MNTQRMINRIGNVGSAAAVRLLVVLAMTTTTFGAAWDDQTAEKLESVTGGRVKVVWQQITDLERYGFVRGGQGGADGRRIMAFDSKERRTRVLVSGPAPVCGAWILDDGEGVVYTHLGERSVNYIRWEGTGQRTLFTGEYCYVLSPWTDPDSGHTWIYVGNHFINAQERPAGFEKEPTPRGDRVYRVRLDDPTVRELVWDRTQVDLNFRVAGDGRMEDLQLLVDVANRIEGHTICALGDAAAWPVQSFVKNFRHEFEYMIQHRGRSVVDGQKAAA